ncbi:MAG: hypothetical protein DDT23_00538 [candidate division WS2 bacterium]|nr:hypothetical protein [Candidatus Lithacetigena glycinireducens]
MYDTYGPERVMNLILSKESNLPMALRKEWNLNSRQFEDGWLIWACKEFGLDFGKLYGPRISISPSIGLPGRDLSISGENLKYSTPYRIYFDLNGNYSWDPNEVFTDSVTTISGTLPDLITITVPTVQPGKYYVRIDLEPYVAPSEANIAFTIPYPPTISTSVSPTSIEKGKTASLTWSSTNATSITVTPSINISPLPLSGSATISPTSTTTYVFTATGPGGTATASTTLTVTEPPPPPPPLYRTVELRIGSTIYKVDGVTNTMDAAPYIEEGRTMVPVRFLAEGLGGTVGWDNATKTVTVRFTKPILEIKLIIGNPTAIVNGLKVPIDPKNPKVVPVIKNNRTFVPLRFLVEQITGSTIEWIPPDTIIMKLPR